MRVPLTLSKSNVIVPVLCAVFLAAGLVDAFEWSAVADEIGGHMASGYLFWETGSYSGGVMNFPLGQLIMALPLEILGLDYTLFTEEYLLLFRLPILILGALLGIALYRFCHSLLGRGAALAALCTFCLSPNMIAHSSLATLDLPIAAFIFFTISAAWHFKRRPTWGRMAVWSIALGCALTTKVQGVMLVPFCLLVLAVPRAWLLAGSGTDDDPDLPRPAPWWSAFLLLLVPWIVVNLVYLHLPLIAGGLVPPMYVEALEAKLFHAAGTSVTGRDQIAYLFGEYSADGWWYWFPAAILVKTPLPVLLLVFVGAARVFDRRALLFVALPIALFLGAAMASHLNIGLRHILIVYPFLFAVAGLGAVWMWQRKWSRAALGVLGAFLVWQAAAITPHHLCFFNIAAGGPEKGDEILIGSNFDWGQSDRFLRDYVEKQNHDYIINPDPVFPTTGRILVKSTALRGAYGSGGPKAFEWLKPFEPVNRIAYTWYEYDIPADAFTAEEMVACPPESITRRSAWRPWNHTVPPAERNTILHDLQRHLREQAGRYPDLGDALLLSALAKAYLVAGAYDATFDVVRRFIAEYPESMQKLALGLGSEVAVRWKVGILNFEGDEYLAGFEIPDCATGELAPDMAALGRSARRLGIESNLVAYHLLIGYHLEVEGRGKEAIEHYEWMLAFTPEQGQGTQIANERLKILRD